MQKIIIGRELDPAELKKLKPAKCEFVCLDHYKFPFTHELIELSAEEKRQINYSVLDEIIQFGDKPIDGKTVAAHLRTETFSLWHYHKFRTYFMVRNLNYERAKLQKIIQDEEVETTFYCTGDLRLLEEEFPGIHFVYPQKKKSKLQFFLLLKYLIFLKLKVLSGLFVRLQKGGVLLFYPERYSPLLDLKTLQRKEGNFLLDYLFQQDSNKLSLITEVPTPKFKDDGTFHFRKEYFRTREGKHPKKPLEWIFVRYGFSAFLKTRKTAGKMLPVYQQLLASPDLSANERLALRFVRSLHTSSKFYLWRYFAAKKFFAHHRFNAVMATDENSPLTKSFLDGAKQNGIPVIGMQHGTMHDLHPAYIYTKTDIKQKVIPDYTLTWGTYWEQFLIEKGNYPKESVVSVGHLRSDIIPELLRTQKHKKEKFRIVFATQPQRDPLLRRQAAFDVFAATTHLSDIDLVIRLHPREFDDAAYYEAIAKEAHCTNFRIDIETDLYELIASCDVLITCFSTVGTETVYFNKPLIIVDHLRQDIQGYHKEGVAFQASDQEELAVFLSGLQNGQLQIDQEAYASFIRKYSYKIDGKVAERIIRFLQQF